jgi:membrane fusion protein (multidrug efflux system)
VALIAACGRGEGPPTPPAPTVTVAIVKKGTVPDQREYVGTLRAVRSVDVRARVRGYLLEQSYVDGERVKEGDVMFRIEPKSYEDALTVAKAGLARARATAARAQADFTRATDLVAGHVMSQAELDARRAERDAADAEVESARAAVETARLDLSYCTVRAPISGQAGRRLVDPGNLVRESGQDTILAQIVQIDPIQVEFSIPEQDRRNAHFSVPGEGGTPSDQPGIPASLALGDGTLYPTPGVVDYIGPVVDPTRGTVEVRATFANPDGVLKPGQFVRVTATFPPREGVLLVPERSLVDEQGGSFVFVVKDDDTVESRPVQLGVSHDGMQQIVDGLAVGERVIADGVQKVRVGSKVKPTPL